MQNEILIIITYNIKIFINNNITITIDSYAFLGICCRKG